MRQRSTLVLAALLVAAVAAVPIAGMAATSDVPAQTNETSENTSEANATAPGEQLAGVVGVQEAEIDGEVDERAYGIKVAKAAGNDSKADVVKSQLDDIKQRLNELAERKATLTEAREDGNISDGRYRAEMSRLAAETQTAKRLANQSETVSQGLPADLLESKGINVTAIQTLQDRANNLTGPEVAEIARGIAGPNVGGPPADRGPGALPERPADGDRMGDGNMTDEEAPDEETTDDSEQPTDGRETQSARSGR
ncbi:hypothetical protein [Salinibaculum rarum]|uniref:hypothetical protein n=1 Tax=Salinibaculum rarum TaxID=3058903 RepID=UPI00265F0A86|nr:hypothetical protein [Salinibaculum sp. KK48]